MIADRSCRIYGALVWMLATAGPTAAYAYVAQGSRTGVWPHGTGWHDILLLIVLPALSGLLCGATGGAKIADRRGVLRVTMAVMAGACLAILAAAVFVGLFILLGGIGGAVAGVKDAGGPPLELLRTVVGGIGGFAMGLVHGVGWIVYLWLFILIPIWTVCVAMPIGALGGWAMHGLGSAVAHVDASTPIPASARGHFDVDRAVVRRARMDASDDDAERRLSRRDRAQP